MAGITYSTKLYQQADVQTADKSHQLILLFDSAVRFLHQARDAMEAGNCEMQCTNIVRTQRIVSALMAALEPEFNPELAQSLWAMYNWIHANLTEASIKDDIILLGEILEIMTSLRDAWRQAAVQAREEVSAPAVGVQAA